MLFSLSFLLLLAHPALAQFPDLGGLKDLLGGLTGGSTGMPTVDTNGNVQNGGSLIPSGFQLPTGFSLDDLKAQVRTRSSIFLQIFPLFLQIFFLLISSVELSARQASARQARLQLERGAERRVDRPELSRPAVSQRPAVEQADGRRPADAGGRRRGDGVAV
jgi:hypothetical protein